MSQYSKKSNPMGVISRQIVGKWSLGYGWEIAHVLIRKTSGDTNFWMLIRNNKVISATPNGKKYFIFTNPKLDDLSGKYTPNYLLDRLWATDNYGTMLVGIYEAYSGYAKNVIPDTINKKIKEFLGA